MISSRFHALAPTDFNVGLALGISIGASVLTFVLSIYFGHLSKCDDMQEGVEHVFACRHERTVRALWFWGGLLFWLNTAIAVLIAIGKDDLIFQSHYEDIGVSLNEYEDRFRRQNAQYQTEQQQQPNVIYDEVHSDEGDSFEGDFYSQPQQTSDTT